ncbi:MAG: GNAT family protein [Anaerolineales bacterium]|jgi:RimJ/RimL family protein N-acetyltransferase|nr:GNAT family protein [Anaerolineales bacterium]
MMGNLFRGELIRLAAMDAEKMSKAWEHWNRDALFRRLLDNEPPTLWSARKIQQWIEKELERGDQRFSFSIYPLEGERLIGFVELNVTNWQHGNAWVGIGIGNREDWGKGYGTDAMRLVLRYAFDELGLYRVTLGVFSYNQRAIRSYQKAGFVVEGRERGALSRDGERSDMLVMGILRPEWEAQQGAMYKAAGGRDEDRN